jgi:GntR family transcriptional repressor for pyruvate dehydrogenase complex
MNTMNFRENQPRVQAVKVNRKSLSDQIVQQIKSMIIQKELRPGDRLPVEQELADKFGVGRHTVREALKKLHVMGLVESKVGKGSFITYIEAKDVMDFMVTQLVTTPGETKNLMEIRQVLEVSAVRLAAVRATKKDIEKLEDDLLQMKLAGSDSEKFVENDMAFHFDLVNLTKNSYFNVVLNAIRDMLFRIQREVVELDDARTKALRFHALIVAALKNNNADEAEHWMVEHLESTCNAILAKEALQNKNK